MHGVLLVGTQPIGGEERMVAAEPVEATDAPIDGRDHRSLAIETLARRYLMPDPEDRPRGFLQGQDALGFPQRNPPAALSQRFGEELMIVSDRAPFE